MRCSGNSGTLVTPRLGDAVPVEVAAKDETSQTSRRWLDKGVYTSPRCFVVGFICLTRTMLASNTPLSRGMAGCETIS